VKVKARLCCRACGRRASYLFGHAMAPPASRHLYCRGCARAKGIRARYRSEGGETGEG
jgi:hypothetical protein